MPIPKRILKGPPALGRALDSRQRSAAAGLAPGSYPRPGQPAGPRLPLGLPPGTGMAMPSTLRGGSNPGGGGQSGGAAPGDPQAPAFPESFCPADAQYLVLEPHAGLSAEQLLSAGNGMVFELDAGPPAALLLHALAAPECYAPAQGQNVSGDQPGDGFLWTYTAVAGAAAAAALSYSNNASVAGSSGAYDCWTALYGRWEWTSQFVVPAPPDLPYLINSVLLVGRPLPHGALHSGILELELRVNNTVRLSSLELWLSDRSGNETSRANVLSSLSSASWAVVTASFDMAGLDADGAMLNLQAVGTANPANIGLTQLDIAAVHYRRW